MKGITLKLNTTLCSLCLHSRRAGLFSESEDRIYLIDAKEWCTIMPNTFPKPCKELNIIRYNETNLFTNS
jgi:hypothetical protein